jgi:uncharacterized RDD family membrane protein YckC
LEPRHPQGRSEQSPDSRVAAPETPASPWHEEIAARVARYRRRRGLPEQEEVSKSNFEFDFDSPDRQDEPLDAGAAEIELQRQGRAHDLDIDLDTDPSPASPRLDTTLGPQGGPGPREDPVEWALGPLDFRASERPVEIVLDSGLPEVDEVEEDRELTPRVAPLGRRFAAGLLDVLVLLIAGLMFFVLFRASGGHVDRQPVNLAIVGFAAAFLVIFYFSTFTALAFATPGQSAVGLRVRTFDGETPGVSASLWRGTGYLVSAVSLMLGFAWAALDPEHLAWHDYMSRTCLVERR